MAKNNKSGLSLADIICTLAVLVTLFFVFCGWCYDGLSLQMGLIITLVTGLVLLCLMFGARSIKTSKPYNLKLWRVVEYVLIGLFCVVALFMVLMPFGKFVNTEWISAKQISDALDQDKYTVEEYSSVYVSNQKDKLAQTVGGLRNYYRDKPSGYDATDELTTFINETVHAGIDQELDRLTINAYEDRENEALNDFSSNLAYMNTDSLYRIANFVTKPGLVSQLHKDFEDVINNTKDFNNLHSYPQVVMTGGRYTTIETHDEFGTNGESKLKAALENTGNLSLLSIILCILLCLFILLPYIVTPRPTLVRAIDKSGKDIGGRPLK